jgi:hypothetical protein
VAGRFGRARLIVTAAIVVVACAIGVAVLLSSRTTDAYAAFRHTCLATPGNTVVVLNTTSQALYMGAPRMKYTMGCSTATGTITAKATTNAP